MNGTERIAALPARAHAPQVAAPARRNLALDTLRIALAVMVVGLHAKLLMDVNEPLGDFLQNYLFRIAVPVFFVINGYYFLAIFEGRQPLRPWLLRIGVLYLLWSAVYGAQIVRSGGDAVGALKLLILGYYHLWYLPATLLAGLAMYALRRLSTAQLVALMLLAYALGCAVQYAANLQTFAQGSPLGALVEKTWLHRNFALMGFPLFGLGLCIARNDIASRVSWRGAWALTAAGALAMAAEFALNRAAGLTAAVPFDMLISLPPVCAGLFLLALKAPWRTANRHLVDVATAIYFAHVMFLLHVPAAFGGSSVTTALWTLGATLLVAPPLIWLNARTNRWFL